MNRLVLISLFVASLLATVPVWARPSTVCETWHDYLYFRDSGEFLAWVGEPYLKCWNVDDNRPDSGLEQTDRDEYEGGGGYPLSSKCDDCKDIRDYGQETAARLKRRCLGDVFQLEKALCASGRRRGRPVGAPILKNIETGRRHRECDDRGARTVCYWVTETEPNPEYGPCINEWTFGFNDEQIDTWRNQSGQPIDITPQAVSFVWGDKTIQGYLGASEPMATLCDEPYEQELAKVEDDFEECAELLEERVERAGYGAYECR